MFLRDDVDGSPELDGRINALPRGLGAAALPNSHFALSADENKLDDNRIGLVHLRSPKLSTILAELPTLKTPTELPVCQSPMDLFHQPYGTVYMHSTAL
jgi:hypothetical protein